MGGTGGTMAAEILDEFDGVAADRPLMWRLIDEAALAVEREESFDVEAMKLVFTIRAASGAVAAQLHERLREADAASQRTLVALLLMYVRGEIEQGDLVRHGGFSKAAASTLVEDLAARGLVHRRPSRRDRRVVLLTLTDAGRLSFLRDYAVANDAERSWAEVLRPDERATLERLLRRLVDGGLAGDRRERNFA
ncbi:MarR family winged helix-turn-helix transcriptional regulator [Litorihabitans aurantiacus]|uniref:HTH marR-type domain-containing protein n=1 Tax=Litorihabitans aurantiacus TaxID=1930061 RepID=A0AA37XH67_9MICO|nr:MarR family winged helix-turn-helix transcriptional regulator [Litorihabitans aurantiacus]GMA33287.1 hypothetical protein GCM10025875_32790 [Litorihabitans aurantiacus]